MVSGRGILELQMFLAAAEPSVWPKTRHQSLRNVDKSAVIEDQERIVTPTSEELSLWCVDAVIGQLKCSVVDGDAGLGAENVMGLDRFFGTHVH